MKNTKDNLRNLIAQVLSEKFDKTYSQINIERTLAGEEEIKIEYGDFKKLEFTAWLFGFVGGHINDDELTKIFVYGFKHGWFFNDIENDDYQTLLGDFLFDIMLSNKYVFTDISDYVLLKYKMSQIGKKLLSVKYALGMTDIDLPEIMSMRKMYESV